jgi:acetylornithine deacetylase/succinyl-diaminopimelate desuccinylase-like protein
VTRIGEHKWPIRRTRTVDAFLAELSDAYGVEIDGSDIDQLVSKLGTLGLLVGATMQNTANPTMLNAGYKVNVIPSEATAYIDGRVLPGFESEFDQTIRELVGQHINVESVSSDIAIESAFDTATFDLMASALRHEDSGARAVPYMIS